MLRDNTNCLGKALKTARKDYVALVTIIPICFIIIESLHVFSRIYDNEVVSFDVIKTLRMITSIIASIAFFCLTLGGVVDYIRNGYKDVRSIWWIVQGLEETLLFILLTIYQNIDYNNDNIVSSFWFWAGLTILLGIVIWFILSNGKPIIPEQKMMWWIKSAQLIWIGIWLGYKPANKDFDGATVVILLVTALLAFYYLSYNKNKSMYVLSALLIFGLPAIILISSFSVRNNKTMEWVYLCVLIITGILYISIVVGELVTSAKNKLPAI